MTRTIAWVGSRGRDQQGLRMEKGSEATDHTAVQIVQRIGAGRLGLRMDYYGESVFLNDFEKRIHDWIIELYVEMTGEERDRAQPQLMDTTLEFSLRRFGLVDR